MTHDRRQGRIIAMQALCQWEVHGEESAQELDDFLRSREGSGIARRYADGLVRAFWKEKTDIDARISAAAENWDLARMSPVERNVLRVACAELIGGKVPPKVVIDEAIEIGREYGGQQSPAFINGVLDAVLRHLRGSSGNGD